VNPLSAITHFWVHRGLRARLIVSVGLIVLAGGGAEMILLARSGAAAFRVQHVEQAAEMSGFLAFEIGENAVTGDYATIRQLLEAQARDRRHVQRIDWISPNGRLMSAQDHDVTPQAPGWFAAMVDIPVLKKTARVRFGGQDYGELVIAFTPTAAENALWGQFIRHLVELGLVIGLSLIAIAQILRGNLATVDRLAQGADRFSRGDYAVRIPASGAPEVRAAAHAFNNMAAQISTFVTNLSESRQALNEQLHFIQELIEALPNPIFFKGRDGMYLGVNKAWEEFFGIPRGQFVGKTVQKLYPDVPDVAALHHKMDQALWDQPGCQAYEVTFTAADGRSHHMLYHKATFTKADGTVAGLIGIMVDITEHKDAQDALQRSQGRLAEAQRIARLGNWERNIVTNELYWSDEAYRIFGLTPQESKLNYEIFLDMVHPDDRQSVLEATDKALRKYEPYRVEYRILQPDRTVRSVHAQGEVEFGADGKPLRMFGTLQDVTERKQAQDRLSYLAYYDTLTGLPNRVALGERMQQAMAEAKRTERLVAVMFLDLDRFKFINDTLGHDIGDALLKMVAERLSAQLRPGDTISRYGGDEFTVVLANVAHVDDVTRIAQKMLERFAHPFRIGGRDLFVTSSVGITLYPLDDAGGGVDTMLKNADAAMYHAKERGRNTFQFYTAEMNIRAARRLSLETGLRHALERNELSLHYQPQVDLKSGEMYGMEALLRWQSSEFGSVSPVEFIPLAEEVGLIQSIGEWVLRTACVQTRVWHQAGFPDLRIGVNLSARQFQQENLVQIVQQALTDSGLEPRYLDLELTESMLMHDMERAVSTLTELDALGVTLSVDDFGTGYSSLSYLKRFPINVLKIDRSFVNDITSDPDDAAIATAIIAMAHSLNIKVVAEGVETLEQQEFLKQRDCDGMQGYYFSKPLSVEDFTSLLKKKQRQVRVPGAGSIARGRFHT
jgi:diguanylate cyclase (GGDEF)-like protein/PAS domain S-box-containing protein